MTSRLLDDFELYSDLFTSVGTGTADRPLTPIECSDLIIRLEKETGESKSQISKRLGLGRKKKIHTLDKPPDTTQLVNFEKLQNLSRKNSYMLGFRDRDSATIPFTIGSIVVDLPNKEDHNIILKTVLGSYGKKKEINKDDVKEIVSRKKKSPETPIEEIIESVMKVKPVIDHYYLIGISISDSLLDKVEKIVNKQESKEILKTILQNKFKDIEISSVSIKEKTLFISLEKSNFEKIELKRKQLKMSMTNFFNNIIREILQNA